MKMKIFWVILSLVFGLLNMYFWNYFTSIHPFHLNTGDVQKWYDVPNFFTCLLCWLLSLGGIGWAIVNWCD